MEGLVIGRIIILLIMQEIINYIYTEKEGGKMFFDNLVSMLQKQSLSSYMMEIVNEMKKNP